MVFNNCIQREYHQPFPADVQSQTASQSSGSFFRRDQGQSNLAEGLALFVGVCFR